MSDSTRPTIPELLADHATIEAVLKRAGHEAALKTAAAGKPVAALRDGKVVWLQPAEVLAQMAEKPMA